MFEFLRFAVDTLYELPIKFALASKMLTVAYLTARKQTPIHWFFDSLRLQLEKHPELNVRVVVVDFWQSGTAHPRHINPIKGKCEEIVVSVKPNIWNGHHRLTKENWFNVSASRNTALCYARDGQIIYVDDLSVLMPGWLDAALEAKDYIACGAYRKVKDLVVEDGVVKSFTPFPAGEDNRLKHVTQDVTLCGGHWAYGCSIAGPVEAFLSVNGWPEDLSGGLGFEDVLMGIVMENAGWKFKYDRRMMTLESEEGHHAEPAFRREDWHMENGVAVLGGDGKDDKSHRALNIARASKSFPNSFGEGGIRALREKILKGEPFPIPTAPDREWYSGKLLSEL